MVPLGFLVTFGTIPVMVGKACSVAEGPRLDCSPGAVAATLQQPLLRHWLGMAPGACEHIDLEVSDAWTLWGGGNGAKVKHLNLLKAEHDWLLSATIQVATQIWIPMESECSESEGWPFNLLLVFIIAHFLWANRWCLGCSSCRKQHATSKTEVPAAQHLHWDWHHRLTRSELFFSHRKSVMFI